MDFLKYYRANGYRLTKITSPMKSEQTFDYYYGHADRTPTVVERGWKSEGPVGNYESVIILYDALNGVAFVTALPNG
jgi:hypothetical protein